MQRQNIQNFNATPPNIKRAVLTGMPTEAIVEVAILCLIIVIGSIKLFANITTVVRKWQRQTSRNRTLPLQTTYDLAQLLLVISLCHRSYKTSAHKSMSMSRPVLVEKTASILSRTSPLCVTRFTITVADFHHHGFFNTHHHHPARNAAGDILWSVSVDSVRRWIQKHTTSTNRNTRHRAHHQQRICRANVGGISTTHGNAIN